MKILVTNALTLILLQTGCAVPRSSPSQSMYKSNSLPARYRNYYDYPPLRGVGNIVSSRVSSNYTVKTIEIPLSFPNALKPTSLDAIRLRVEQTQNTDVQTAEDLELSYLNRIDLYEPHNTPIDEKRPAILISPILGGTVVVDHFAKYYAKHGFIAAIVHRKEIFWNKGEGIEQIEMYLRLSIIRIRQALDWLLSQPNIDNQRIGAFGVSYGAIMHSVLAAVDNRVRYHILAMPAAPLADVIVACPDPAIKQLVPVALQELNEDIDGLYKRLQDTIITDPMLLKGGIHPDRMEFYIALFDRVVGTRKSFRLWKTFGEPRLKVLPTGHYGGILALPLLQYQTRKIFEKQLYPQ